MNTIVLKCIICNKDFKKSKKEFTRQVKNGRKKTDFCCSYKCGGIFANRNNKAKEISVTKNCLYCKKSFDQIIHKKRENDFCSRSCASSGSMTQKRLDSARRNGKLNLHIENLLSVEVKAKGLLTRESWKYIKLKQLLTTNKINHKFEYPLKGTKYVFDLALLDKKIFIEFDAFLHLEPEKEKLAKMQGWKIIRKQTKANCVLSTKHIMEFV